MYIRLKDFCESLGKLYVGSFSKTSESIMVKEDEIPQRSSEKLSSYPGKGRLNLVVF